MSSLVEIGAALDTLGNEIDTSPEIERSDAGDTIRRKYHVRKANLKAVTDALSYGTADATYTDAVLSSVTARPVDPSVMELTLVYAPASVNVEILPPVGTVTQDVDANAIEIPISKSGISDGDIADNKRDGVEAYLSPQPIYRRTEILGSFTFNESNIIDDVGKIDDTPEGIVTPSVAKWLKVGLTVRTVGAKYEKVETWQYAENEWDTNIYDTVP